MGAYNAHLILGTLYAAGRLRQRRSPSRRSPSRRSPEHPPTGERGEGGEVLLDDGAKLVFEPGALSADSEVVFSRSACTGAYAHSMFGSCRYEVAGLESEQDARYQLVLPRTSPTGDPVLRKRASQGFASLLDSNATTEAIRASGVGPGVYAGITTPPSVEDARCTELEFSPCGGELDGSWTLAQACGSIPNITGEQYSGATEPYEVCTDAEVFVDSPFTVGGKLRFSEYVGVGFFELNRNHELWEYSVVAQSCLDRAGSTCDPFCSSEEGACVCTYFKSQASSGSGEFWEYGDEGEFRTRSEPSENPEDQGSEDYEVGPGIPYCVQGDDLTVKYRGSDGAPYFLRYTRD